MTVHIEDVLLIALTQRGKPYIFGAEAKASDPNPKAFDCSELVEWSCGRAGVTPTMPDGAYNQWKHCDAMPVTQGMRTRGALLFVGDGKGSGRNAITHVAWSLGDGTTVEARGRAWGVGCWPSVNRFDFAGLVPGIDYTRRAPLEADMMEADFARIQKMINDSTNNEESQLHKDIVTAQGMIKAVQADVAAIKAKIGS
jgi:cell wall-associated NlpC family hydrolase